MIGHYPWSYSGLPNPNFRNQEFFVKNQELISRFFLENQEKSGGFPKNQERIRRLFEEIRRKIRRVFEIRLNRTVPDSFLL